MGFGFNLLFPFLVLLAAVSLLIALFFSIRRKTFKPMLVTAGIVMIPVLILSGIWLFNKYYQPMNISKGDIYGNYRIDTTFYPGKQARWQYEHIRFELDSHFYKVNIQFEGDSAGQRIINGSINWKTGSHPQLWEFGRFSVGISAESGFVGRIVPDSIMILGRQPILYRSHNRFYYVFENTPWGNLFFRKEDDIR